MSLCHHCCLGIGILTDKELEFVGEWEATAIGVTELLLYARKNWHTFPFSKNRKLPNWFKAVDLSNIDYSNAPSFTLSHKTVERIGLFQALKHKIPDEQFFSHLRPALKDWTPQLSTKLINMQTLAISVSS